MAFSKSRAAVVASAGLIFSTLIIVGCQASGHQPDLKAAATIPATPVVKSEKGGAELWAETCSHCHNLRSPSTYGPAQWEVALYDMRVRANLTGEQQRKILEFLKAASQ